MVGPTTELLESVNIDHLYSKNTSPAKKTTCPSAKYVVAIDDSSFSKTGMQSGASMDNIFDTLFTQQSDFDNDVSSDLSSNGSFSPISDSDMSFSPDSLHDQWEDTFDDLFPQLASQAATVY